MPAKPINVGPLHFVKKGDAANYLRAILYKYDPGDQVSITDAKVLMDALTMHPDATAKIGSGVSHFSVRSADYGTRCFWVNRIDGTTAKFSYKSCLYNIMLR